MTGALRALPATGPYTNHTMVSGGRTQACNPMIKPLMIILVVSLQTTFAARTSMVIFPLVNRSGDSLHSWVANVIPENFSRKFGAVEGIRVWDPIFMFQTDSTGWRMQSDSLLKLHCNRWEWDAAIGGSYEVGTDSVAIHLKIVWVSGTRQHVGMDIEKKAPIRECPVLCRELLGQITSLLHIELSTADSLRMQQAYTLNPKAYYTYCAGYGFEMNQEYAKALTAYNRAVELDPSSVLARCRLGRLYSLTGKTKEGLSILKKMMKKKELPPIVGAMIAEFVVDAFTPKKAFAYVDDNRDMLEQSATGLTVVGRMYLDDGEYQRAIASFRRAIAWGASNLEAEYLLGMSYLMSGEYRVAIDLLNRLIGMRPDHVRYYVLLGTVYRKSDRLMESLAILEVARKKEPKNSMVLVETAHTSFALGWYRKAGQLLEAALRLKPDQYALLADLGIIYWHEKRFDDAQRYLKLASRRKSGEVAAFVNRGNIAFHAGNLKKALSMYRKAIKFGGNDPVIQYNLAMTYLAAGKTKKAAFYLDGLLAQTPGRVDLLLSRAKLAKQLGNDEDAEMAYRRILENDPINDVAVEGLVRFLLDQERYEEAIFRIESYLESKPARADFMLLLGDAYRAQGWFEVAISRYEKVLEEFPDYGAGYLGIGRCMVDMIKADKSEKVDEAIYALKQAESKLQGSPEPYELMGDLYMDGKGYRDLAIEQWRKALTLETDAENKRRIMKKLSHAERR